MNKIEEFIENHCVERRLIPKGKNCDEHMSYWLVVSREDLNKLITSAVKAERERCKTALNKVHDKYQNEFHGGYDNEETLNQRCIAVADCLKAIRGE